MLGSGEHGLARVTARAARDVALAEGVRRVTARARWVSERERRGIDTCRSALPGMAARAPGIRSERGLVHRVTVETTAYSGVARVVVAMARRAGRRLERGRAMRPVTVTARLFGVRADRSDVKPLRLVVASHAARRADREIGTETVAVLAGGLVRDADRIGSVQWRRDLAVTLRAEIRGRRREPRVAVAVATRDVRALDVRLVTGTVPDRPPRLGDVVRYARRPPVATRRDDED
jgi:hypothetical protein